MPAKATWSGIWNRSACVASIAGDIRSGQDALALDHYGACDAIITNPPYTRDLMHRLIEHFQRIAPTWLLLETDWVSTLQAVPYLPHCSDIVTIGRVKWIEGSKHTGKDNHAWFRFDARHKGATAIHRRNQGEEIAPLRRAAVCEQCRKSYQPQRSTSRFCSPACRQRAHHKRLSVTLSVTPDTRRSGHGSIPLCSTRRRPEIRGGRLAGNAGPRGYAPRRILGADASGGGGRAS